MFDERDLAHLKACQMFFLKSYKALARFGVEGMTIEYAEKIRTSGKLLFIVDSLNKALMSLEGRMLDFLAAKRKNGKETVKISPFDVAAIIAAREWIYELGRMYYICPRSDCARYMAQEGFIDMSLSKNGNDYVEKTWRIYGDYMQEWMQILHEIAKEQSKQKH